MSVIDSLKILLGIDPTGVSQGMGEAEQRVKAGVQNIVKEADGGMRAAQSRIQNGIKGFLSNVVAPLSGAMMVTGAFNNYISQADKLGKLAKSMNADVSTLDAWSSAVENAGGSADAFLSTFKNFHDGLRNAALTGGGSEVARWLHYLGISARDSTGKIKEVSDVLPDLAEKMEGMGKQKQVYILKKLGLDEGSIALVQKGKKSMQDLVTQMKLFSYTKRDAEVAREFNAAMNLLKKGSQSVANILFQELTPAITYMSHKFIEFIVFLKEHEGFVKAFFGVLIAYSSRFLAMWMMNPVIRAVAAIISVISTLAAVIDDLVVYMHGGKSALADFWSYFGTGEEIAQALADAWEVLIGIWGLVQAVASQVLQFLIGEIEELFQSFTKAFQALKTVWTDIFAFFKALFTGNFHEAGQLLRQVFKDAIAYVKQVFVDLFDYVQKKFQQLSDWVNTLNPTQWWDKAKKGAKDFYRGVTGQEPEPEEQENPETQGLPVVKKRPPLQARQTETGEVEEYDPNSGLVLKRKRPVDPKTGLPEPEPEEKEPEPWRPPLRRPVDPKTGLPEPEPEEKEPEPWRPPLRRPNRYLKTPEDVGDSGKPLLQPSVDSGGRIGYNRQQGQANGFAPKAPVKEKTQIQVITTPPPVVSILNPDTVKPVMASMQYASAPVQAQAVQPSGGKKVQNTNNVDTNINIGTFTVQSTAQNLDGTIQDASTSFGNSFGPLISSASSGVVTK